MIIASPAVSNVLSVQPPGAAIIEAPCRPLGYTQQFETLADVS